METESQGRESLFDTPSLGVRATVVMGRYDHCPTTMEGKNDLREIDGDEADGYLVSDLDIVSHWTFHVALYGLQNPTPENLARALYLIGTSGDCEEHTDEETLLPLPVPEPNGWNRG